MELQGVSGQEIVEDEKSLLTQLRIADGDQKVVFHLLEDLEPALSLMAALEFCRIGTANIKNLHVVSFEHLIPSADDNINQSI